MRPAVAPVDFESSVCLSVFQAGHFGAAPFDPLNLTTGCIRQADVTAALDALVVALERTKEDSPSVQLTASAGIIQSVSQSRAINAGRPGLPCCLAHLSRCVALPWLGAEGMHELRLWAS
jgi:hypothetical protein